MIKIIGDIVAGITMLFVLIMFTKFLVEFEHPALLFCGSLALCFFWLMAWSIRTHGGER